MGSIRLILIGISFILFGISCYPFAFYADADIMIIGGLVFSMLGLILTIYASFKKLD